MKKIGQILARSICAILPALGYCTLLHAAGSSQIVQVSPPNIPILPSPAFPSLVTPAIYSEIVPTSSGLSYDPATDFQNTFIAPNGQTVTALVKGPQTNGYVYTMAPFNAKAFASSSQPVMCYFRTALHLAIQNSASTLVIPAGTYNFEPLNAAQLANGDAHWIIGDGGDSAYSDCPTSGDGSGGIDDNETSQRIQDLEINLSGSTLNFPDPNLGIEIINVDRVRLMGFSVNYPHLRLASLGTIVAGNSANNYKNLLLIDAAYPIANAADQNIDAVNIWDPVNNTWSGDNTGWYPFYQSPPVNPTYMGNQLFSCTGCQGGNDFNNFAVGTRVVARHYYYEAGAAIRVDWSNDVDLERFSVFSVPGNAVQLGFLGGYRGLRIANMVVKRKPGQLISATAGGINPGGAAMKSDLIVESSEIADGGDDAINIQASISPVIHASAAIAVVGFEAGDPDAFDSPVVGDTLAFFDENLRYLGSAAVVSATPNATQGTLRLALNPSIPNLNANSLFTDLTQQAEARFVVQGNNIHNNIGNGTVVSAPYGLISNNQYSYNAAGIAISGGTPSTSGEGPGASNILVSNNSVSWAGSGNPASPALTNGAITLMADSANGIPKYPVLQKIVLTNNTISNSVGEAVLVSSAANVLLLNNTLDNSNLVANSSYPGYDLPASPASGYSLILTDVSNVGICGSAANAPFGIAHNIVLSTLRIVPACPSKYGAAPLLPQR